MKIYQRAITLREVPRGFHLITAGIVHALPELKNIRTGMCQTLYPHNAYNCISALGVEAAEQLKNRVK
ncbi:MAG TPA: hypothetical protein VLD19_06675 [Chitinophagaceae bacterium]|nr:hypothetical protein [Chitinophagaceae bacterium]